MLRRVERIIDEESGRMLRIKNTCIVLDDVTCTGASTASARGQLPVLAGDLAGAGGMSGRPVSPPSACGPRPGVPSAAGGGARQDELVVLVGLPAPDDAYGHDAAGDGSVEDLAVRPDGSGVPHAGRRRRLVDGVRTGRLGQASSRRSGRTAAPTCRCRRRRRRWCRTGPPGLDQARAGRFQTYRYPMGQPARTRSTTSPVARHRIRRTRPPRCARPPARPRRRRGLGVAHVGH